MVNLIRRKVGSSNLRVYNVVEQRVNPVLLVVAYNSHSLFAHSTLVCVTW